MNVNLNHDHVARPYISYIEKDTYDGTVSQYDLLSDSRWYGYELDHDGRKQLLPGYGSWALDENGELDLDV